MGDRTTAYLELSGPATLEQAKKILSLIKEEGGVDVETYKTPTLDSLGRQIMFEEANYGLIDSVTDALQEMSVGFVHRWDSGGSYGAGGRSFDGLTHQMYGWSELEGSVVIAEGQFVDICRHYNSDAERIGEIQKHFQRASAALPDFCIIGYDPNSDGASCE